MSSSGPVRLPDAVSLKDGKESAHQQMLDICRKALPGWEQLTLADVEVRRQCFAAATAGSLSTACAELQLWNSRSTFNINLLYVCVRVCTPTHTRLDTPLDTVHDGQRRHQQRQRQAHTQSNHHQQQSGHSSSSSGSSTSSTATAAAPRPRPCHVQGVWRQDRPDHRQGGGKGGCGGAGRAGLWAKGE